MSVIKRAALAAALLISIGAAPAIAAVSADGPDEARPAAEFVPGRVLVKFAVGVDAASQRAVESAIGASRISSIDALGLHVLSVPEGAEQRVVDALSHSGKVDYAELDGVLSSTVTPTDPSWSQQWGEVQIGLPQAWDVTTGSAATIVADIDSGVDASHPDLAGQFTAGYDFVNNDADATDDYGHGTYVAGVIGAVANNGRGLAGVCWSCRIMPVRVVGSDGRASISAAASGITWATDHGARILNLSLAGSSDSTTLHNAIAYAVGHDAVVVAAAGNYGNNVPVWPAAYPEVLSVAGSTSNDTLYGWSNYGSWVDVAAPGCNYTTVKGGSYSSQFCGTSSATPVAAGVAALVAAAHPDYSAGAIKAALETTAVPLSGTAYGRLDAVAAVSGTTTTPVTTPSAAPSASPAPSPSPTTSPSTSPTTSASPTPVQPPATTTTTVLTGSLNKKATSRTHTISLPTGDVSVSLTFSRASSLTLALVAPTGATIATSTGGSPVTLAASVTAGTYQLAVGDSDRASYTLEVTSTPA